MPACNLEVQAVPGVVGANRGRQEPRASSLKWDCAVFLQRLQRILGTMPRVGLAQGLACSGWSCSEHHDQMSSGLLDSWQSSSFKSSQSHRLSTLRTRGSIREEMDLTGAIPPWLCLRSFLPSHPPPAFCHCQGFQNMLLGSDHSPVTSSWSREAP